jgi:DHA1 family tetracycline resistance protein-like MFS transporter
VGILTAFSFGVLPRFVVPRIGETRAVYVGLFFAGLGYAGYASSAEPWMIYAWMIVWALGGMGGPALNAIMSKSVPANEQGELMGALACAASITSVAAPVLMTSLFAYFTSDRAPIRFPGASFAAAAAFELAALVMFVALQPRLVARPVVQT